MIKFVFIVLGVYLALAKCAAASSDIVSELDNSCQQSFQLKILTKTEFQFKQKQLTRHKLTAFLSTRKLEVDEKGRGLWWGVQLTDVKQQANGQPVPNDPVYGLPFAVLRNADGHLLDYHFPVGIKSEQQVLLKGLTEYLQFPDSLPEPTVRKESDSNGELEARYQLVENNLQNSKAPELQKQKLRYLTLAGGDSAALTSLEVKDSSQTVTLSDCWLLDTRGRETLLAKGQSDAFQMLTSQTYSLRKAPQPVDSLLWQLSADPQQWDLMQESAVLSEVEKQALAVKFKTLLGQLDVTDFSGTELSEWLLQFDAVIAQLQPMLLDETFSDAQQKRLYSALGILDTANGNQLLVNLINSPELDETNRFRSMRAISNGTSPLTPQLTEQLLSLLTTEDFVGSESLHGAALMTLGAVLKRREVNELSDSLLFAIRDQLRPDSTPAKRAALIASLGNAGSEKILDDVSNYINDSEQRVRANVATSLGQIGGEEAYKKLGTMLQNEGGQHAQQAILGAIAQFELSDQELLRVSELAHKSSSERTRGLAITALSKQTHKKQQVQVQLQQIMKVESSKSNFKKAAKALVELRTNSDS